MDALGDPLNTFACLNALAENGQRRQVVGPRRRDSPACQDETNRQVRPIASNRLLRRMGGGELIGLFWRTIQSIPAAGRSRPAGSRRRVRPVALCSAGFLLKNSRRLLVPRGQKALAQRGSQTVIGHAQYR
jgi:hypothetical protein